MVMILIILIINIVYVSFFTIRMILTLKGQKYLAAFISSIEVMIYVIGLGLVLENLNEIQNLIAYAVGYSLGVLAGMKIEEMLALGYVTVKVITNKYELSIPEIIREQGYGVTSWDGEGRDGRRLMMEILARRKSQEELYNLIIAYDPKAFIISHEPRHFHGGFWVKGLKNQAEKQGEEYNIVHEENLPGVSEESVQETIDQYDLEVEEGHHELFNDQTGNNNTNKKS
ncbi:DUF2179 domain-containing protein [Caldalkalibacillus salinus]|uniref:DUF2179 domain-containing protein n=1 Tax=Caldalkalibacillus salinus TaxID=2803787 RepID=UPI001921BFE5|nr:DUF2179 domain-containing protein [Caldalkalibacillus salinus]